MVSSSEKIEYSDYMEVSHGNPPRDPVWDPYCSSYSVMTYTEQDIQFAGDTTM